MLSRELENSCLNFTFQFLNLDNARLQRRNITQFHEHRRISHKLSRNEMRYLEKPNLSWGQKTNDLANAFFRDLEQSPIHETVSPWPRSCLSHAHLISSSMKISCAKPRLRVRLSLLPSLPGTLVPRCTKMYQEQKSTRATNKFEATRIHAEKAEGEPLLADNSKLFLSSLESGSSCLLLPQSLKP